MVPNVSSTAAKAVTQRAASPLPVASSRVSGTREVAEVLPRTVTLVTASPWYSTPTTTSASVVTTGRVRLGSRNSADRWVTASQPAKEKNSRLAADPTAAQPYGRNGARLADRACGAAS